MLETTEIILLYILTDIFYSNSSRSVACNYSQCPDFNGSLAKQTIKNTDE